MSVCIETYNIVVFRNQEMILYEDIKKKLNQDKIMEDVVSPRLTHCRKEMKGTKKTINHVSKGICLYFI